MDLDNIKKEFPEEDSNVEELLLGVKQNVDKKYIQITVSKEQLDQRIAAFCKRKRDEINIMNIQQFCWNDDGINNSSCARTNGYAFRTKNSNSHLKFTKVVNNWGPLTACSTDTETKNLSHPVKRLKTEKDDPQTSQNFEEFRKETVPSGIEERLVNMESHLNIKKNGPVPKTVYHRLQALENRILYLEGLSPEYFCGQNSTMGKIDIKKEEYEKEFNNDDYSLKTIDEKIFQAKRALKTMQMKTAEP